ncbi:histidine phosphatase family protein [Boudabousia marimammalium]|uniref:RNase H type-1 domain-containing protein n=1 Tax=Boudabousia marimammalium TaxID=156892 RepID=A0A1Q5PNP9_9ACTO|nr:histidine phosphatase family protein [Boudabousia marimammalium]OKL49204.1 hypothetical protein BM477_04210 [Boudabousia marimammalium]
MRRLVINTDGGSRGNPGIAGYGLVIVDADTEEEILTRSVFIAEATNNVAEYSALVDALMQVAALTKEWGEAAQVMVRADSKLVVEQMTGNWKIKDSSLQRLAIAAQRAYPARLVTYKWVPRAENKHADALANEAMDRGFNPDDPADADKVQAAAEAAKDQAAQARKLTATSEKALSSLNANENATQVALDGEIFANLDETQKSEEQSAPIKEDQNTMAAQSSTLTETATDTYLVLVRHGATKYTEAGLLCGGYDEIDPPLSEAGLHQISGAAALTKKLGKTVYSWIPEPTTLYASPVKRAAQLGELLGENLALPVQTDERLREINVGEGLGKSITELFATHPDLPKRWMRFEKDIWPGLESLGSMIERLGSFTENVWKRHEGETVVVACHEIVTRVIAAYALHWPGPVIAGLEIPLASTTILRRHADGKVTLVAAALDPELGR